MELQGCMVLVCEGYCLGAVWMGSKVVEVMWSGRVGVWCVQGSGGWLWSLKVSVGIIWCVMRVFCGPCEWRVCNLC